MLKYLMKYDLKNMLKLLLWFYLIAIALAGITRFFNIWNDIQIIKIICIVFTTLTYSAIANVIVNTFIHIIRRFITSFYKDESYLTHTLPVTKNQLLLSKYLSSLIVIILSVVASFLSLFILLYSPEMVQNIKLALESTIAGFSISSGLFVFLFILITLLEICTFIGLAFMAIVKGFSYNHRRGTNAFAWFIIYYFICQTINLVLFIIVGAITGDLSSLFSNQLTNGAFILILIVSLVAYLGLSIASYFLCKREFIKGVNVD